MFRARLDKVVSRLEEAGLCQMVITDPVSIFYLTGWHIDPMERLLAFYINSSGIKNLIVNELYTAPPISGIETVYFSDTQDGAELLSRFIVKDKPLGIDKSMAAKHLLKLMEKNAASSYLNSSYCVDRVRACKDEKEAELMRVASLLNDRAMEEVSGLIRAGITERALAEAVACVYKKLETDGVSFEPLIGFGANSADGHHAPDDTKLCEGDAVLIDIGCKKDGYCSDMTRTLFFGSVTDRMRTIYNLVKAANETAREKIRPGVPLREIDAIARNIIESAGYGKYFNHRLGHFIGIEVHESGDVSAITELIAEPGMIFSIEPGIYLPQEGGVRIEDLVHVTETGCETLNHLSRELKII